MTLEEAVPGLYRLDSSPGHLWRGGEGDSPWPGLDTGERCRSLRQTLERRVRGDRRSGLTLTGAGGAVIRPPHLSRVPLDLVPVPADHTLLAAALGVQSDGGGGTVGRQGGAGDGGSLYLRLPVLDLASHRPVTGGVLGQDLAGTEQPPVLHLALLGLTGPATCTVRPLVLVPGLALPLTHLVPHLSLGLSVTESAVGDLTEVLPSPLLPNLIDVSVLPAGDLPVVGAALPSHQHRLQDEPRLVLLDLAIITGLH